MKIFVKPKVMAVIGDINEGKSNLLYFLIDELKRAYSFKLYAFGLKNEVVGAIPIYTVQELESCKDSIIVIDELFSLFDVDNRKIKAQIEKTLRLIHHNNNILILCGVSENFKKFLSAKINVFFYKKTTIADLINGSRVKNVLMNYSGVERGSVLLNIPKEKVLFYDGEHYYLQNVPYMKKYDTKIKNVDIIVPKNVPKKVRKKNITAETQAQN
jgi:hypothetical protein